MNEWHTERLDLDAYLRRVGHSGPVAPDASTLEALHRAHIASIAFENLDVILGRGISVELVDVEAKLVGRRRGGYCYEHAVLFGAVLDRIGFRVDRLLARTGDPAEHPRPRSHMVLAVGVPGDGDGPRRWLADVGFGSGLLEPLPLVADRARRQGAWEYRLRRGTDGAWRLQEDGTTLMTFTEEPQYLVDVEVANYNTSTNPNSPFTRRPVVVYKDDAQVRRLLGREHSVERPGKPAEQRLLTDEELAEALTGEFGLPLTAAEIEKVVAR